jgi:NitT/TauT family transport system permease protein
MTSAGWIRTAVVFAFVGIVELMCRTGLISHTVLIPPSEMAAELLSILAGGQMTGDIASTFRNALLATVIAVAIGFVIGVVIHTMPTLRRSVEPLLASYYSVPTFIFYPVFIVLFGVGDRAIIAIAVLLAVVAMITATLNGIDRIPPVLTKTARMYRMSRVKTAILVELPAAAPYLFTGVKLSVAYAFIGVIASEFILSGSGLGYEIAYAYNNFENRKMYALMLLVLLSVALINSVLDVIDNHLQSRLRR